MRLFVAVSLPDAEKVRLAALLDALRGTSYPVRWSEPGSIHITMKFLGEVAEQRVAAILEALQRAARGVTPFDIEIGGFGAFPGPARPHVFWIGVAASAALRALQERVESELGALGYAREERDFSAHLTVGRPRESARVKRADFDRIAAMVDYQARITVSRIDLMRSHLGRGGARYETLDSVRLYG